MFELFDHTRFQLGMMIVIAMVMRINNLPIIFLFGVKQVLSEAVRSSRGGERRGLKSDSFF